jgi:hypothetical protein
MEFWFTRQGKVTLHSVPRMAPNVFGLGEGGALKAQMLDLAQKLSRIINVK